MTKKRPNQDAKRLREIYDEWRADERMKGRRPTLVTFATELGYESHSAVGDMLNGRRGVSAQVAVQCRKLWDVSPSWLLCGDGAKYCFQNVEPGTLEEMLKERLALAIARASTPELPLDSGVSDLEAQGLRVGVDVGRRNDFDIDVDAAIAHLEAFVIEGAKKLATEREDWGLQFLRESFGAYQQIGVDPMLAFENPSVRRALRRKRSLPDHPVIKAR